MTAPRVYLLQMLHLKRAAFLLDLVQRPLEGTVCWPAADSSSQWVEATEREEGRSSPIKGGVLGSLCKCTTSETRGKQTQLASSAKLGSHL